MRKVVFEKSINVDSQPLRKKLITLKIFQGNIHQTLRADKEMKYFVFFSFGIKNAFHSRQSIFKAFAAAFDHSYA